MQIAMVRRLALRAARASGSTQIESVRSLLLGASRRLGALDDLKKRNERRLRDHVTARETRLESFPAVLQIEHSSACNLRCRMCCLVRPSYHRAPEHLSIAMVERLRRILPYVRKVKLNGAGEPFLVPEIERFLEIFRSYGIRLNATTNGTLVTERLARLIGETFAELIVSMDGATRETFEGVRAGARFDRVREALVRINRHRRDGLVLSIGFVAMRCNLHELPALVQLAKDHHVQNVLVSWLVPFDDLPWTRDQDPALEPERTNPLLAQARSVAEALRVTLRAPPDVSSRPSASSPAVYGDLLASDRVEGHCHIMFDRAMILLDGRVKPCCHSLEIMGNVCETPFEEIWNGSAYQELRASFWRGRLPASCRSCNFLRSGQLPGARLLSERGLTS